jgi:hypothetical protein
MPNRTKTQEPQVRIIPSEATPQKGQDRNRPKRPHLLTLLLSLLALIALIHFIAVMHSSTAVVIVAPPMSCPGLIHGTDYTQLVHLQPKSQEMGAVQFVNQLIGGQPAALVQVQNTGTQQALDVYIYGCAMQKHTPKLTTLFTQRDLLQGTASITSANTLATSELDTTISPQASSLIQPMQQNVYREYSWQHGTFVQVAFPSLYPVTSRGEAEALQQQANNGQTLPWSDPIMTAEQMAKDIFKWPAISPQDAVSNNNSVTTQVQLIQQTPPLQVTVTLERLVQHNSTGLWFVTRAQSTGLTVDQPHVGTLMTSPTAFKGTGALPDGQTMATPFDHTLTPLSLLNNPTLNVDASGTYTGILLYTNAVQNQPGLLLVQSLPPSGSTETGQLLLMGVILG